MLSSARLWKPPNSHVPRLSPCLCTRTAAFDHRVWAKAAAASPRGSGVGVVAGPRSDSTGCGSDAVSSWLGPVLGARHVLSRTKSLWLQGSRP